MAWQSACCYFRCVVSTKLPKISSIHSHIPGSVVRECVWGTAKHEWLRGHNNSMWWQAWKNTIIRQNKLHLYQHFWKKPQALMKPEHTYKAETPDLVVANESQCSWHFSSRSWVVWLLAGQRQAGRHHSMYLQHKKKKKKKLKRDSHWWEAEFATNSKSMVVRAPLDVVAGLSSSDTVQKGNILSMQAETRFLSETEMGFPDHCLNLAGFEISKHNSQWQQS